MRRSANGALGGGSRCQRGRSADNLPSPLPGKWHVGLATPDHTPRGRGWDNSLIYFDGANDYWTSISGACGKLNGGSITDLWVTNASYDGPALGQNNSWACTQVARREGTRAHGGHIFPSAHPSALAGAPACVVRVRGRDVPG